MVCMSYCKVYYCWATTAVELPFTEALSIIFPIFQVPEYQLGSYFISSVMSLLQGYQSVFAS